jgi:demethylmenaquinone methyltransferase/2-methoxy-6-polyprenyl-1,4-benzoquinol methylase
MSQAPLPSRTRYWERAEDRRGVVDSVFSRGARYYDRSNDIMSFGSGQAYRRSALKRAGVKPNMTVLDVGVGTGLLAREAALLLGSSGRIVGIDPSFDMMAVGRRRNPARLVQGFGERLPFGDGQFDFVTMGYALRHVDDLDQAFGEYRRVLKTSGGVLLLEITEPKSAIGSAIARAYFGTVVPWLTRLGTMSSDASQLMSLCWDTITNCVEPEVVLTSLRRAGFDASRIVVAGVFSEYIGTRSG